MKDEKLTSKINQENNVRSNVSEEKKECKWNGKEFSHGAFYCDKGENGEIKYKCNDGEWDFFSNSCG